MYARPLANQSIHQPSENGLVIVLGPGGSLDLYPATYATTTETSEV